MCSAEKVKALN